MNTDTASDRINFYLCTHLHCSHNRVRLKLRPADRTAQELNGPALARALRQLVGEKGLGDQVRVRETSCMRGCLVGPRLNVVGGAGFRDAVRYLHLPADKRHLKCAAWQTAGSLEEVLERHVEDRRLLRLIA